MPINKLELTAKVNPIQKSLSLSWPTSTMTFVHTVVTSEVGLGVSVGSAVAILIEVPTRF